MENIDQFDNRFFNITPSEANLMDPQQRILLEETLHCIEDSGLSIAMLQEKITAVYTGFMGTDYRQIIHSPDVRTTSYSTLGNYSAIISNRLSHAFGFRGPSIALDAACASSLIALHLAKQALMTGESDYAIAGGVSLNLHPWKYLSFSKARMLSPDGQCKTFDKNANGYVPGDGVGLVLLQRLDDALNAGNHVYGILKGTAANHSGTSLSITAPRVEAQRDVILAALRDAGVNPETVSYVEAHGTGTSLGDPIEIEGLTKAFQEYTSKRQFCKIGSAKTNIGHLEAAAGIAGVIKVLLMMRHRKIPRTLNVQVLNPIIHFKETPFEVALAGNDWENPGEGIPLRAGVNAFGFGGANAHALLEAFEPQAYGNSQRACFDSVQHDRYAERSQSPSIWRDCHAERGRSTKESSNFLFILSAKSPASLNAMKEQWKAFLESERFSGYELHDICATLMTRRATYAYRYGWLIKKKEELQVLLQQELPLASKLPQQSWCLRIGKGSSGSYARILPLIMANPSFHQNINRVHGYFAALTPPFGSRKEHPPEAFFSVEAFMIDYAYLAALVDLGCTPHLITYEQTGLWTALVLSGIISVEDALAVLTDRKTVQELAFARPRIPVYDPVTRQTFLRYHFDEEYVRLLMDELMSEESLSARMLFGGKDQDHQASFKQENTRLAALLLREHIITQDLLHAALAEQKKIGGLLGTILVEKGYCTQAQLNEALRKQEILRKYVDEVIFQHVDKARLLSVNQFTFKKFLEEWHDPLHQAGENLWHMLHDNKMLSADGEKLAKKKLLFMIIIMTSLYKLERKWNLREDSLLGEHRFHELLDLVVDEVMPRETLVELFLSAAPDYAEIARVLNTRQHLINSDSPYEYITEHSRDLWEIGHASDWIEQALSKQSSVAEFEHMRRLEFGTCSEQVSQGNTICTTIRDDVNATFKETLLKLWLQGVDVHWNKLYAEGTFKKASLPGYVFDRKSFWVTKQERR